MTGICVLCSATVCTACSSGFGLIDGICVSCSSLHPSYLDCTGATCTLCDAALSFVADPILGCVCQPLVSVSNGMGGCTSCSTLFSCLQCTTLAVCALPVLDVLRAAVSVTIPLSALPVPPDTFRLQQPVKPARQVFPLSHLSRCLDLSILRCSSFRSYGYNYPPVCLV